MIFDKIENAGRYLGISYYLDTALRWLMNTDLMELENGTHPIDGENVFVNVMDAQTDPAREREYEFHRNYYDIQVDICGCEDVLFGTEYEKVTAPWQEDIGFGICRCAVTAHLMPGRFVICEPNEPHLPGTAPDGSAKTIRKAVLKVRVSYGGKHEDSGC